MILHITLMLRKNRILESFNFTTHTHTHIRCHARAMLWACDMLVCCCGFVEKEYMEKNYCNSQYFQGKKYKAKFATSLILKK